MKDIFIKTVKLFFTIIGIISFVLIILSFTDIPYYAYYGLGMPNSELLENEPDVIVIPGGAGMPSPDGLIRIYYGAEAAKQFLNAEIIIAHPYNRGNDSLQQLELMANELILKGVDSLRIQFEPIGFNTWSQAENVGKFFGERKNQISLLIVTSPEHVYRAVKTYEKVGFLNVSARAAFEKPIDENKLKNENELQDVNLSVRYNMWSYLNYELLVLREYSAIAYYKMRGWI